MSPPMSGLSPAYPSRPPETPTRLTRRHRGMLGAKQRPWEACFAGHRRGTPRIGPVQFPAGSPSLLGGRREGTRMQMTAGITKAGTGVDGIVWNILGQTYVPKQVSESSFSWHATLPPGTFVPPHIHPTQDEFIYMLEG